MANLNLSQFGENTSVSDADYTFVWDSAASISKKVSRNSWLNSGTLTSSAPVTISQTWNAGSNVMTALKVVATDTASGATSNLLELWAGSTPALDFAVTKAGVMQVYGTYSSAGANYARLALACDSSGNATISTQALGTGTAGTVSINGVPVGLGKGSNIYNVAIGTSALAANTTGAYIVAVGSNALQNNTTGNSNTAVGLSALYSNTTGPFNTAFGLSALQQNSSGGYNTAIGSYALESNSTAGNNIGIGFYALRRNTTGANNLAIGHQAGYYISGGSTDNALTNNSIYLGANTKASASGETNQIVIGYDATGIGSNSVVLGNDSITKTALKGNVGIGTTSPTSKLHVAGSSSPTITVENTLATGYSQFLFKNTAVTGDGFWLNGSAQSGYGGPSSFNLFASSGPMAFHTTSVTNALSIAQNGAATFNNLITSNSLNTTSHVDIGSANVIRLFCSGSNILRVSNQAGDSFSRVQLGGVSNSYPAIKRNGANIDVVLADDSGFTFIKGKLSTETAFTATTVTPTGFITLYDSTGTAYRVPCVAAP